MHGLSSKTLTASSYPAPAPPQGHSTPMKKTVLPGGTDPCARVQSGRRMSDLEAALGLGMSEYNIHEGKLVDSNKICSSLVIKI